MKKYILSALGLALILFVIQSCTQSNSGGSTGGNPLDSSLPLQVSVDAQ